MAKIFEIGTYLIRTLSNFYDEFKVFDKKTLSQMFDRVIKAILVFYGTAILKINFVEAFFIKALLQELCHVRFFRNLLE